jgi:ribonuclease HII
MIIERKNIAFAGVDEVGRGPLAGPVIAAAVILDKNRPITGLRDSKKLSAKRRQYLSDVIMENSLSFAFGRAEVEEIDEINIFHASLLAMQRAVNALTIDPDHALIDGKYAPELDCDVTTIIGGDDKEDAIAAASIIAKVSRDQEMMQLHESYPDYGFDRHKGYPTKLHIEALKRCGITRHHRRSFRPVRRLLEGMD